MHLGEQQHTQSLTGWTPIPCSLALWELVLPGPPCLLSAEPRVSALRIRPGPLLTAPAWTLQTEGTHVHVVHVLVPVPSLLHIGTQGRDGRGALFEGCRGRQGEASGVGRSSHRDTCPQGGTMLGGAGARAATWLAGSHLEGGPAPSDTLGAPRPSPAHSPRLLAAPFLAALSLRACCSRKWSSSALRSRPGQAQMRPSKDRRPSTCPLAGLGGHSQNHELRGPVLSPASPAHPPHPPHTGGS